VACQPSGTAGTRPLLAAATAAALDPRASLVRRKAAAEALVAAPCQLPPAFVWAASGASWMEARNSEHGHLACPAVRLMSGGRVFGGAGAFAGFSGCSCFHQTMETLSVWAEAGGTLQVACTDTSARTEQEWRRTTVLVGVLPSAALILAGLVIWCAGRGAGWVPE
jgi:hypothetical protein